ncbi:prolyl 4-hydroxylase subunit alpha-3-like isoform X2 [Branchiostoma floridae x Branchiostoma belcheri]
MPVRVLLFMLLPALLCAVTDAGFFSAVVRLEKLVQKEREVVARVKQYIQEGRQVSTDMQRYVNSFDDGSPRHDNIAHHPVRAYLLIKRLSQVPNNLSEAQVLTGEEVELPTAEDLYMSALALVRLQHVYNLDMRSLVRGQIVMVQQPANGKQPEMTAVISTKDPTLSLDTSDTFYIGDVAYKENSFYQAMLWFNMTLEMLKVKDEPTEQGLKILDVLLKLADTVQRIKWDKAVSKAMIKLGNVCADESEFCPQWASMGECDINTKFMLYTCRLSCGVCEVGQNVKAHKDDANADDLRLLSNLLRNVTSSIRKPFYIHENLCRLGVLKNQAPPHPTLTCRYVRPSPYFYLSPVKMEVLHDRSPLVTLYHDVITDKEADFMTDMALQKLARSPIQAADGRGPDVLSSTRISETGWLFDAEDPMIAKLSRRVGHITGLEINCPAAEAFQVVNYGLGGLYEQHVDVLRVPEPTLLCLSQDKQPEMMPTGERIVTFLFYNSAVLFQDLKKSLDFEENSLHAGCPVLLGSKWIANKWIRAHGNEFRWPCGLTPEE